MTAHSLQEWRATRGLPPPASNPQTFREVLLAWRLRRNMTQDRAAREIGVSAMSWTNWENGTKGCALESVVRRLLDALEPYTKRPRLVLHTHMGVLQQVESSNLVDILISARHNTSNGSTFETYPAVVDVEPRKIAAAFEKYNAAK